MAIDLQEGGRCIRCKTCDGFPCKVHAKGDAEICCVRPALGNDNVELWTNTLARRILTDSTGKRASAVEVERSGESVTISADRIIVSCGAANSAILLLKSANETHPDGLANSSGMLGRNYMVHNNTALTAVAPFKTNPTVFQKTMAVNDFYFGDDDFAWPMGNIQLLGKLQAGHALCRQAIHAEARFDSDGQSQRRLVGNVGGICPIRKIASSSAATARFRVRWKPNNRVAHQELIGRAVRMMRRAGLCLRVHRNPRHRHQFASMRHGALWGRSGDICNRSLL